MIIFLIFNGDDDNVLYSSNGDDYVVNIVQHTTVPIISEVDIAESRIVDDQSRLNIL